MKGQTKVPKDMVVTTSFKAVMTRWTWVKCERAEGRKALQPLCTHTFEYCYSNKVGHTQGV
jgi:hypothetical protein